MRQNNTLQVYYDEKLVGTLAMTADHKAAFQFTENIQQPLMEMGEIQADYLVQ